MFKPQDRLAIVGICMLGKLMSGGPVTDEITRTRVGIRDQRRNNAGGVQGEGNYAQTHNQKLRDPPHGLLLRHLFHSFWQRHFGAHYITLADKSSMASTPVSPARSPQSLW
jgi:hypothetical protein